MKKTTDQKERRKFVRLSYIRPLNYKVCKRETVSKLLKGYTVDISQAGLLCSLTRKVNRGDLLWICFDRGTLDICEELEKRALIYQSGVIGKVVRVKGVNSDTYNVGIQFITREEKNLTHIWPKVYFIARNSKKI